MKHAFSALILSVALAVAPSLPAAAQAPTHSLTIVSGDKSHAFTVEVANTRETVEKGLAGRASLEKDHGLLIDYRAVGQPASPTMKGVTIGLDLLFLGPDGTITGIIQNARPGSLRPLWTGLGWVATLEIPAGQVAELKIKTGDKATTKALGTAG